MVQLAKIAPSDRLAQSTVTRISVIQSPAELLFE